MFASPDPADRAAPSETAGPLSDREARALTNLLKSRGRRGEPAEQLEDMLALWRDRGERFNSIHMAVFLTRVGEICDRNGLSLRKVQVAVFCDAVIQHRHEYELRALGDVARSLNVLGADDPEYYDAVAERTCRILADPPPAIDYRALANIATAFAYAKNPHKALFDAIDACAMHDTWPPQEAKRLLAAHAMLDKGNPALFTKIGQETNLKQLDLASYADLISSHCEMEAKRSLQRHGFLREGAAALAERLEQREDFGDPAVAGLHLARIAQGLARRGVFDAGRVPAEVVRFCRAAAAYFVDQRAAVTGSAWATLAGSLAYLRLEEDAFLQTLGTLNGAELRQCGARELAALAHALFVFRRRDQRLLFAIADEGLRRIADFTEPAQMVRIAEAFSGLNVKDQACPFLEALAGKAAAGMNGFSLNEMASIAHSYADLHIAHLPLFQAICRESFACAARSEPSRSFGALAAIGSSLGIVFPDLAADFLPWPAGMVLQYSNQWGSSILRLYESCCLAGSQLMLDMLKPFTQPYAEAEERKQPKWEAAEEQIAQLIEADLHHRLEQNVFIPPSVHARLVAVIGAARVAIVYELCERDRVGGSRTGERRGSMVVTMSVMQRNGYEIVSILDADWAERSDAGKKSWLARELQAAAARAGDRNGKNAGPMPSTRT